MRKPLTRTQRSILSRDRGELRSVTTAERLAHPDKFSPGGSYLVPQSIRKITARTAYVTTSRYKDFHKGVSHSKAAKLHAQGLLEYKSAASREQAAKTRTLRALKKQVKVIGTVSRPASITQRAGRYHPSQAARSDFIRLRARKLRGEFLDDGDWREMIDIAQAVNDPMLSRLMQS